MEKYGVQPHIMHQDLRDEEAQLMTKIAGAISATDHDAEELRKLEQRLHSIRTRITELDTKSLVEE